MKIAVITGAANGLGLALSQVHLERNNLVVMVDNNTTKLQEEAERLKNIFPGKIMAISCDVSNKSEAEQLAEHTIKELGQVHWIYNNAGIIGQLAPVWDLNSEDLHQIMDVNVHGMIHIIQAFIPFLFQQNIRAHIINMASLYALCSGSQTASYSMSKHATLALSESLYFDLTRLNKPVDVSVVFPSFTNTGLLSNTHELFQSLLSHSRPALDTAKDIVKEVEQKKFYIFPDKEVKGYCEERIQALLLQKNPHRTPIEKLISALVRRQEHYAKT
jgi:short-subunit dehydrogenase